MSDHHKPRRKKNAAGRPAARLTVRLVPGEDVFEFVPPPCADERAEDMEQVHAMLNAGETDAAVDELRWLLEGCNEMLEAHRLLGEIALSESDLPLARGHFGFAYELGLKAFPKTGPAGLLPYARPTNRAFFEAGKGLATCLDQLGEAELAREVVDQLLSLDPSDPLKLRH